MAERWHGSRPKNCQICGEALTSGSFVDGKTKFGPWGILCLKCHEKYGVGLGTGKGQRYDARTLEKLEG